MALSSNSASILDIDIASITILSGRRRLDPSWVETLSDLFAGQGQLQPIEVIAEGDRFRLVYGAHRLAAARLIGWKTVRAIVKQAKDFADEAEITLREITENLARRELSALDRAVDIARWREVYEATHLVAKPGPKAKPLLAEELTAKFAVNFSVAATTAFGLSERSIFNAVKIASIPASVRDLIALHPVAGNQSELLALAAEPVVRQEQIAALLTAEPPQAGSVADAIAILDRTPKPAAAPRWLKLADDFSKIKPSEQDRFFELHEAAIQRWMKGRQS
ncbi:ParB N-terminal domain-containing protein [Mesorhizobium sp. M0959]|uniref:ParB/RepB/Spo0J family partition protein n=1 Tax=unclassified Mesorhizobium TaxID=325217 RepID=UPI00333AD340